MQSGQSIIELPGWSTRGYNLAQLEAWAESAVATGLPWMQEVGDVLLRLLRNQGTFTAQTSGSTGKPRTIHLSHQAMRASARATLQYFQLTNTHTMHLCLPANRIGGTMVLVRALEGSLRLTLSRPRQNVTASLLSAKADFVSLTPHQCAALLTDLQSRNLPDTPELPILLLGGAPVSVQLENHLVENGITAFLGYGMTETVSHIALRPLNGTGEPYHTLPGISVSAATDGTLIIQAPQLGLPEVHTTDLCEVLDSNRFHWLGRSDFAINSGGIKIHPESLEQRIAHLAPGNFAVSAIPDEQLGERCVLVLERQESLTTPVEEELLKNIRQILPRHHEPRRVIAVNRFPLTHGGKLDRIALKLEISKK